MQTHATQCNTHYLSHVMVFHFIRSHTAHTPTQHTQMHDFKKCNTTFSNPQHHTIHCISITQFSTQHHNSNIQQHNGTHQTQTQSNPHQIQIHTSHHT